jgi:hypothetical protein
LHFSQKVLNSFASHLASLLCFQRERFTIQLQKFPFFKLPPHIDSAMLLVLKSLAGELPPLEVSADTTIKDLKQRICDVCPEFAEKRLRIVRQGGERNSINEVTREDLSLATHDINSDTQLAILVEEFRVFDQVCFWYSFPLMYVLYSFVNSRCRLSSAICSSHGRVCASAMITLNKNYWRQRLFVAKVV